MEIKDARTLKHEIEDKVKKEKFEEMLDIQQRTIENAMKEGEHTIIWVFSDKEYYHSNLGKTWFNEFADNARMLFEGKGYKIHGSIICW